MDSIYLRKGTRACLKGMVSKAGKIIPFIYDDGSSQAVVTVGVALLGRSDAFGGFICVNKEGK